MVVGEVQGDGSEDDALEKVGCLTALLVEDFVLVRVGTLVVEEWPGRNGLELDGIWTVRKGVGSWTIAENPSACVAVCIIKAL